MYHVSKKCSYPGHSSTNIIRSFFVTFVSVTGSVRKRHITLEQDILTEVSKQLRVRQPYL